ncbi:uncharacterized protein LOC8082755 isoform X2 [Sorghum bicolor]|uniref:Amino acid transporter transmembrane domain-containing protein n=1 Tax=Sorghum bicolor TaxID=4558 RepID=A0A1Z5R547_SORBI|nr:uncharacterized protein LOC8082755 isoform X2 [Sorghum bicolor]OQU78840.1 hypothetical protein SORBI_3008G058400 [Sorghum bicolor]|eukprot:XP_021302304.1 uncharacterized protein LOC8082755 isoform X2 [Sorghum bicolor]
MEPVSVEAGNAVAAEWLDLDDDGRPRHMGASAHIITAAIGSGVISLAWAIAHLGWVAGPTAMLLIAFVTYCIAQTIFAAIGIIMGSLIGAVVTSAHKVWHSLQALGGIAFAYCFSINLIEIQDTIKAPPPSESKVMQNSAFISLYAVFRDAAPDSLLTVLGFYEPFFWLLDIAIITPMLLSPACRTIVHSASSHQSGSGYRRPGTPGTSSMARMPKTGAVKRWIGRADAVIPGRNHPAPTLTRDGDCLLPHTCDWFGIMGSAVISTPDKSCVISASVMCMSAQYRRFNKKYDGANSWSLEVTAEAVQSLKKMCKKTKVWDPSRGARSVEGVLNVICSQKKGIPTVHDRISLKLKSYESFGQLSPRKIASMLRNKGPVIGVLYAGDEESYLSSTVYRGNRSALGERHAVVCTGCREVNGELCLVIMDNLEREGPFRFVLHEAFEEFHILTVDTN